MGKAGKCTKMQGLVSYSWAVTSCQEPTNSDVQMQTALPSERHCTPVIYYILSSVTRACIWTSKREGMISLTAGKDYVCVSLTLIGCKWIELSLDKSSLCGQKNSARKDTGFWREVCKICFTERLSYKQKCILALRPVPSSQSQWVFLNEILLKWLK